MGGQKGAWGPDQEKRAVKKGRKLGQAGRKEMEKKVTLKMFERKKRWGKKKPIKDRRRETWNRNYGPTNQSGK